MRNRNIDILSVRQTGSPQRIRPEAYMLPVSLGDNGEGPPSAHRPQTCVP